MYPIIKSLNIKAWAEDDRPREKMMLKGKDALSDAELLAILIGTGTPKASAVEVAKAILSRVNNNLHTLGKLSIRDLMAIKGIGTAKAIGITAALELGRRRQTHKPRKQQDISDSVDVYNIMHPQIADLPHEEFWVLLLNKSNRVIKKERISIGGVDGTIADIKMIFKSAIDSLASSIILCHNHPSGNLQPSGSDVSLTKKMKQAGEMLNIKVLDHVIVTETGFYSFADEGVIKD